VALGHVLQELVAGTQQGLLVSKLCSDKRQLLRNLQDISRKQYAKLFHAAGFWLAGSGNLSCCTVLMLEAGPAQDAAKQANITPDSKRYCHPMALAQIE
jgi:hypothetical protein